MQRKMINKFFEYSSCQNLCKLLIESCIDKSGARFIFIKTFIFSFSVLQIFTKRTFSIQGMSRC